MTSKRYIQKNEINIHVLLVYIKITMNSTSIVNMFRRIYLTHVIPPLGRWSAHNYNQTTLKIKYANEDNCGISKGNSVKIQTNNHSDDNEYIYIMGYESVHN